MSSPRSDKMMRLAVLVLITAFVAALSFGVSLAQGNSGDAAAAAGASIVSLICSAIIFVIDIALVVWTYQDANKRGANGCLWAIVVFFLGLIGLILYILLRPKTTVA